MNTQLDNYPQEEGSIDGERYQELLDKIIKDLRICPDANDGGVNFKLEKRDYELDGKQKVHERQFLFEAYILENLRDDCELVSTQVSWLGDHEITLERDGKISRFTIKNDADIKKSIDSFLKRYNKRGVKTKENVSVYEDKVKDRFIREFIFSRFLEGESIVNISFMSDMAISVTINFGLRTKERYFEEGNFNPTTLGAFISKARVN